MFPQYLDNFCPISPISPISAGGPIFTISAKCPIRLPTVPYVCPMFPTSAQVPNVVHSQISDFFRFVCTYNQLMVWHLRVPHLAKCSYLPKNHTLQNVFLYYICNTEIAQRHQKLSVILENKMILNLNLSKNIFKKKCGPKFIFFSETLCYIYT